MHMKIPSAKWWSFCPWGDEIKNISIVSEIGSNPVYKITPILSQPPTAAHIHHKFGSLLTHSTSYWVGALWTCTFDFQNELYQNKSEWSILTNSEQKCLNTLSPYRHFFLLWAVQYSQIYRFDSILINRGRLTHICVSKISLFQIVAACRLFGAKPLSETTLDIVNCILGNKFHWKFNENQRSMNFFQCVKLSINRASYPSRKPN